MVNRVSEALVAESKSGGFREHGGYWRPLGKKVGREEGFADLAVVGNGHEEERNPPDMGVNKREGAWRRLQTEVRNNFEGDAFETTIASLRPKNSTGGVRMIPYLRHSSNPRPTKNGKCLIKLDEEELIFRGFAARSEPIWGRPSETEAIQIRKKTSNSENGTTLSN